jgi:hypothetical protein
VNCTPGPLEIDGPGRAPSLEAFDAGCSDGEGAGAGFVTLQLRVMFVQRFNN